MTWAEWLNTVLPFVSAIGVIVAGIASILWSKHYRDAKEAELRAKDAQIETLKAHIRNLQDLTSVSIAAIIAQAPPDMNLTEEEVRDILVLARLDLGDGKKPSRRAIKRTLSNSSTGRGYDKIKFVLDAAGL